MNTHLIELSGCAFGYARRTVVRVDHLYLHAGKCLGIFGPNGAGKTTLVRGITGLLAPLRGSVHSPRRLRFGYLPQHRALELHWPMSGLDAAALAISARNVFGWLGAGRNKLRATMAAMGIDQLARRPFAKLSGGQQQRLLLAGALASDPQVLLLDEPTDGLDVRSREILLQNLRQTTDAGLCTVIISHDVEDLLTLCDEVAWLHRGEAEFDSPSHVELIAPELLAERVLASRKVS